MFVVVVVVVVVVVAAATANAIKHLPQSHRLCAVRMMCGRVCDGVCDRSSGCKNWVRSGRGKDCVEVNTRLWSDYGQVAGAERVVVLG